MSMQLKICASSALAEHKHRTIDVDLANERINILLFRFEGVVYAYRNSCVHMEGNLGGETGRIFDPQGEMLRCRKHGVLYCPESGVSMSNICHGKQLDAFEVIEEHGNICFNDPRIVGIAA